MLWDDPTSDPAMDIHRVLANAHTSPPGQPVLVPQWLIAKAGEVSDNHLLVAYPTETP